VQAGKYPNTPEGRIQAQRDLQPLPQTQVAIPTAGGFNISTIRGGGFVPDGSVSPAQMGQNLAGASRDRLSSFSTILSEASKVQRMLSKANPNSFGPIVGRYTLADIQKFGGALEGLTPEQVELADAISNLLTSAAFGDGGKQLTGTELTRFEQVAPKLQDNLPTAIQHVKDTIEFFQERGKNDLKLMSPQQLSRLNSDVKTLFSVPTSIGGSGNGGGNGGDLSKMTDEELFRIAIGGGSGGKK
jgi:hypothetical protein